MELQAQNKGNSRRMKIYFPFFLFYYPKSPKQWHQYNGRQSFTAGEGGPISSPGNASNLTPEMSLLGALVTSDRPFYEDTNLLVNKSLQESSLGRSLNTFAE